MWNTAFEYPNVNHYSAIMRRYYIKELIHISDLLHVHLQLKKTSISKTDFYYIKSVIF